MRICTILGARPQFIKAAILSRKIRKYYNEVIIHTGQHYDYYMSDIFFEELQIPQPEINLGVQADFQGRQIGEMIIKLEEALIEQKPNMVLIYGDTNSTLAAAIASSKLNIPILHIEAGLRSYNKNMTEEQNRVITDHLSSLLFVPTENALENLKKENIFDGVYWVGDVMYDNIIHFIKYVADNNILLQKFNINNEYVLATIHRAENTNNYENLKNIVEAFNEYEGLIVLPLHPRTARYLNKYNLKFNNNVLILEPVSYFEMLFLEYNAKIIATDSGGIQKEAFFLKKPCITLRNETEWIETLNDGWNILVGANKEKILKFLYCIKKPLKQKDYFGSGNATDKIIEIIINEEPKMYNNG
ncbi:non-hydrolyzing UDP-N-acetylglucosamine 2-epimerase [Caldicellulosiruptoraceae bacterium PP1]